MSRGRFAGFTIIELLVVMAVCSILIALLLPAVQAARESARQVSCSSNLRQLGLALHNYESSHGVFPPGSQVQDFSGAHSWSKSFGWPISLLPFIEQADLYSQFNTDLDAQIHHRSWTSKPIASYSCPSDPNAGVVDWSTEIIDPYFGDFSKGGWGTINYPGVSGTNGWIPTRQPKACGSIAETSLGKGLHDGMFFGNSAVRFRDVTDGTSSTLFLAERGVTLGWGKWGGAGDLANCPMGITDVVLPGVVEGMESTGGLRPALGLLDDRGFWWSWHPGGTQVLHVDGSVRMVSYSVNRNVLSSISTRGRGERFSEY